VHRRTEKAVRDLAGSPLALVAGDLQHTVVLDQLANRNKREMASDESEVTTEVSTSEMSTSEAASGEDIAVPAAAAQSNVDDGSSGRF
jgi:hypothetical protein